MTRVKPPRSARRVTIAAGTAAALFLAAFAAARPSLLARVDDAIYDILLRTVPASAPSSRVVIVNIDERSLSTIGQWPWSRSRIAELVTNLRDLGASVVGMDVIFAEAGRQPDGRGTRTPARDQAAEPDDDLALALRGGQVVLGYGMTFDRVEPTGPTCGGTGLNIPIVRSVNASDDMPFFRATGGVCNLAALVAAADASGFLNAAPDRDGILRRAPLLIEYKGGIYQSLGLTTVNAVAGTTVSAVRIANEQAGSVVLSDGSEVPIDGRGNLLLRYRGKKGTFPYVSAVDVLNKQVPTDWFKDKLVLVGTTALGVREVVSTPLDTLFAGVEVQATIADNLLQRDFVRRSESSALIEGLLTLAFGIGVTVLMAGRRQISVTLAGLAGISALWAGSAGLLFLTGLYLSPLYPTVAFCAAFAIVINLRARLERRRADRETHGRITAQQFMVQSLLSLTESRSAETGRHSRRTQTLTKLLATELSKHPDYSAHLTPEQIELLSSLAPLHDIGKVGVRDAILNKPGKLSGDELTEMRRHPEYGRDVISNAERRVGVSDDVILTLAKEIAYTHHERWDGTGYPEGLRGSDIPIAGRLIAVVDVYDATANRDNPYSPRMTHEESLALIVGGKGTHFDPNVVDAFVRVANDIKLVSREHDDFHVALPKAG